MKISEERLLGEIEEWLRRNRESEATEHWEDQRSFLLGDVKEARRLLRYFRMWLSERVNKRQMRLPLGEEKESGGNS